MNKITKYTGLIAILPLLTVALTSNYVDEASAISSGSNTKFGIESTPEVEPDVDLSIKEVSIQKSPQPVRSNASYTPVVDVPYETFSVVYTVVNAADSDVKNVQILLKSDTEEVETQIQGKLTVRTSAISVLINAVDPASISAEIVSWEI